MIDNETDAAPSSEVNEDDLEHAVGGLMARPGAAPPPKVKITEDPCAGGQIV